jgi:spore coat protein A, manganese oxidase
MGASKHGMAFYSMDGNTNNNYSICRFPNVQQAAPLWFHDHALGATRLGVYAGLVGVYFITDPKLKLPAGLSPLGLRDGIDGAHPDDDAIIPLVLQDRKFDTEGQLYFTAGAPDSPNPEHQYWVPEFFGDTNVVNGKVWPYLEVKAQRYRFLAVNGSNARTYILTFQNTPETSNPAAPAMWQIATDGGYLDKPVAVDMLRIMLGERADFIIDFGGLSAGDSLVLNNVGPDDPFGGGSVPDVDFIPSDPATTGKVMEFRVVAGAASEDEAYDPASGAEIRTDGDRIVRFVDPSAGTLARNVEPDLTRQLTLNEVAIDNERTVDGTTYSGGPLMAILNNTDWMGLQPDPENPNTRLEPVSGFSSDGVGNFMSEMPHEGATELWEIVNTTEDAHPIHVHLVQFQLLNRQNYDSEAYFDAYSATFDGGEYIPESGPPASYDPALNPLSGGKYGGNPNVDPYLLTGLDDIMLPDENEAGWKDTIMVPPGAVTRFVVRFAPTDLPVMPSQSEALRYDFMPNAAIPGKARAIYDYVWHCHILDHEDNEMMRPYAVVPNPRIPGGARSFRMKTDY